MEGFLFMGYDYEELEEKYSDYLQDDYTSFEKFHGRVPVEKKDKRTKKDLYNEKRKARAEEKEELLESFIEEKIIL